MRKILWALSFLLLSSIFLLQGCHEKKSEDYIRIGTMAGPETELVEVAQQIALKKYGLKVDVVQFTDYLQPNMALESGHLDANMFQHIPFLEQQISTRHYQLVPVAKMFIFPMGVYSLKYKSINDLPERARIAIPNDPTNEARALLLLQSAGLIKIAGKGDYSATPHDIISNPHQMEFIELEGPQLPRSLDDVDAAVINNTFAFSAGFKPGQEGIFMESNDSPYANVLVVRKGFENDKRVQELVDSLHSSEVVETAAKLFKGTAKPAWQ